MSADDLGYDERLSLARGELARLALRLRSLSPVAWRSRRTVVVRTLSALAELGGQAEHRQVPTVPAVADHALADAVVVIGGDAIAALATGPDEELLSAFITLVQEAREGTR